MRTLLIIGLATFTLMSCVHRPDQRNPDLCGSSLSDEAILRAAQRWVTLVYPGVALADIPHVIQREDSRCGYAVILTHGGRVAIEDVVILIDRRGKVLNIPECCDLGDCPQFCAKSAGGH